MFQYRKIILIIIMSILPILSVNLSAADNDEADNSPKTKSTINIPYDESLNTKYEEYYSKQERGFSSQKEFQYEVEFSFDRRFFEFGFSRAYDGIPYEHISFFYTHRIDLLTSYLTSLFTKHMFLGVEFNEPTIREMNGKFTDLNDRAVFLKTVKEFLIQQLLWEIDILAELRDRNLIENPGRHFIKIWNFDVIDNPFFINILHKMFEHYIWPVLLEKIPPQVSDVRSLLDFPLFYKYKSLHPEKTTVMEKYLALNNERRTIHNRTLNDILLKAKEDGQTLTELELIEFLDDKKFNDYIDNLKKLFNETRYDTIDEHFREFSLVISNSIALSNILEFQKKYEQKGRIKKMFSFTESRTYARNAVLLDRIRVMYSKYFRYSINNFESILFFMNNFFKPDFKEFSRHAFGVTQFSLNLISTNLDFVLGSIKNLDNLDRALRSEILRPISSQSPLVPFSALKALEDLQLTVVDRIGRLRPGIARSSAQTTCSDLFY